MTTKLLGLVVAIFGMSEVCASMGCGYEHLLTLGGPVAMKSATAMSLVIVGLMLYLIPSFVERAWHKPAVFLLGFLQVIFYWQYMQLSFMAVGGAFPLQSPFGSPSLGTVLCLFLSGVVGVSKAFNGKFIKHRRVCSAAIGLIAAGALTGHIAKIPTLYWAGVGSDVGIAIPTALAFLVVGVAIWLMPEAHEE